jgi:hypothetical protein
MVILSGWMAKPGDSLSSSDVKEPRAEKCDGGGGVESDDEFAEKERRATFACDTLHLESRLHIGRKTVIILQEVDLGPLTGSSVYCYSAFPDF